MLQHLLAKADRYLAADLPIPLDLAMQLAALGVDVEALS